MINKWRKNSSADSDRKRGARSVQQIMIKSAAQEQVSKSCDDQKRSATPAQQP